MVNMELTLRHRYTGDTSDAAHAVGADVTLRRQQPPHHISPPPPPPDCQDALETVTTELVFQESFGGGEGAGFQITNL